MEKSLDICRRDALCEEIESNINKSYLIQIIEYFTDDRERTDRQRLSIALLSNFFFNLTNFISKNIMYDYPKADIYSIIFYRSLSVVLITKVYFKYMNIELFDIKSIKSSFTFLIVNLSNFTLIISLASSFLYLRFGIALAFLNMSPVIASIFSVYFFGEKCYLRYFIGIISCVIAMSLLTLVNQEDKKANVSSNNLLYGVICGLSILMSRTGIMISSKIISNEIDAVSTSYYVGLSGLTISFLVILTSGSIDFQFFFVLLSAFFGVTWWFGNFFQILAFKINPINRIAFIDYLGLVYGFLLGIIFFGEAIKFTDIIGCIIIVGYSLYSIIYPLT